LDSIEPVPASNCFHIGSWPAIPELAVALRPGLPSRLADRSTTYVEARKAVEQTLQEQLGFEVPKIRHPVVSVSTRAAWSLG
jgi:hypothetical protein